VLIIYQEGEAKGIAMYHYYKLLGVLLIGLLSAFSVFAQDEPEWVANIYNQETGIVLRIMPDGTLLETEQLPLPEGFEHYGYEIAVRGSLYAYVVFQLEGNAIPPVAAAVVTYDGLNGVILGQYSLDTPLTMDMVNAAASSLAFVEDGARVMFGMYGHDNESTTVTLLELSGEVVLSLDADLIGELSGTQGAYWVDVFNAEGSREVLLRFTPALAQPINPMLLNVNLASDGLYQVLEPVVIWEGDILPERFEALLPSDDVLRVVNLTTGEEYDLYRPQTDIFVARYVRGGEMVMLVLDDGQKLIAHLIDRDAQLVIVFDSAEDLVRLIATPDGYVAFNDERVSIVKLSDSGIEISVDVTDVDISDVVVSIR
jgi:hypothetical protein